MYQSREITKKVHNTIIKSVQTKNWILYIYYTVFMNSEKSKTSETHVLILKLTDKLHLRRGDKSIVLSPTWNDEFELPDELSYSVSDIQGYFEYI